MSNLLSCCKLCPRNCSVDRSSGELGFCKSGHTIKAAKAFLHHWEEPCISGDNGSGTVFFSNCNLRCVFCQNHLISQQGKGVEITIEQLSDTFLKLQDSGAHNINLVTPTHYVPQIIEALDIAKNRGLSIPILYNTNSYENIETIEALKGYVDVFLADLKYYNDKYAVKYSNAPRYFEYASKAIDKMYLQVGKPVFSGDGLIKKGIIIRHLMLPGLLFDSKKIIEYIYNTYENDVYISIMNQYTPLFNASKYKEIDRRLNQKHYEFLIDFCVDLGITNAFIQESESSSSDFVPDFDITELLEK